MQLSNHQSRANLPRNFYTLAFFEWIKRKENSWIESSFSANQFVNLRNTMNIKTDKHLDLAKKHLQSRIVNHGWNSK